MNMKTIIKQRYNNEEHVTALLLKIGKHNKNLIKKIISKLVDIPKVKQGYFQD